MFKFHTMLFMITFMSIEEHRGNIVYYYPYKAFGGQNKIMYSTRFVTRRAILL